MAIRDGLLSEFDHEMIGTRKTLERVPAEKFDYTPHPKSFTMKKLATHVAEIPGWIRMTLEKTELDIAPAAGGDWKAPEVNSTADLVALFDKNVADGRSVLAAANDAVFFENWSLLKTGQVLFTMPKVAVLRSFVYSHLVHHRAQLGLYLRMNDIPVPSIYGPSADEQTF